jgi:hypothetical protein
LAQDATLEEKASQKDQTEILQEADSVFKEVSRLSGLSILKPVPKSFKNKIFFRDYYRRQMREQYPPAKKLAYEKAYTLLGMLPAGTDLIDAYLSGFLKEVQGLYDPQAKMLYIADWVPPGDQEETLAHELTHALQDQHFDLAGYLEKGRELTTDEQFARVSVMEGQAVAIALNLSLEDKGTDFTKVVNIAKWIGFNRMLQSEGDRAFGRRTSVNEVVQFPYVHGATFLQSYVRAYGWAGMAPLFKKPPTSTHQILHPGEFFPKRHDPLRIAIGDLSKGPLPGYSRVWEDRLGEYGLGTLLSAYGIKGAPLSALGGWRGDQFQVYEKKEDLLLVGFLHFKEEAQADDYFRGYRELMDKKFKVDLVRRDDETIHWIALAGGGYDALLERFGPRVVIVEGVRPDLIVPVRDELWDIHSDKKGPAGQEKPKPPVLDTP